MKRPRLTITLRSDILKKLDKVIDGRTIRNRSHAIETFLSERLQSNILKKAIILGGGEGIEINGQVISKLLLPIKDKLLLERNIEVLKSYGITDIILSLGNFGNQIREKIGDGSRYGIKLIYFERDLGKAGVLRQARNLLEETFLMMNGDILLEGIDIGDMYNFHKSNGGQGTILLSIEENPSVLGTVSMKGNLITKFVEKPKSARQKSYLINGGVYLLEPEICQFISPDPPSLEHVVFPRLAKGKKLFGYNLDQEWVHLHDKRSYRNYLIKSNLK